ncbi:MAG TPA: radical SAM family heme chaperone HemW [Actinomycetes bacterium]|jgi:oxygen-independent coproporphyrinogen-3 oxidase|nr:radical SAM family heme chaperone HemW [Actinomycetes bacterium]
MTAVMANPALVAPLVDPTSFGAYVHVPFCLARCHYCDFVTYTGMEGLRRPYAAALLDEAAMAAGALGPDPPVVTSVFVGGGTPTLLPPGDLARVLDRLRSLLPFAPDAEVTIEANPETVDLSVADGLVAAGVTRVSMGAQSFDDRVLAALGRVHDAARVGTAVGALRAAGVPAVNLDLIYGGPGEDAGSWSATLAAALALRPEHLSAYALTIEPATKFGRLVAAGRMAEPDEDQLADRYDTASAVLADAGYGHYEVSNWAAWGPGDPEAGLPAHASRHNLTYWRRGRYLGLGAGAHEFDGETRRWNQPGVPAYLEAVRAGRRPTQGQERLDPGQARFEALALRLRTADGLEQAETRVLGVDPGGPQAAELRAAGLLAPGPGLRLTERGMFLHGEVVTRLA